MAALAAALIGAQIGGAIMKGLGGWHETKTQVQGYKSWAKTAEQDAEAVERAGRYDFSQSIIEARRLRARQLVQYAKSGVLTEGTPNLVMAQTKAEAERDAAFALDTATRRAQGMRIEAAYSRWMAASAKMGGIFGVLAGAGESAGDIYSGGEKAGLWGRTEGHP